MRSKSLVDFNHYTIFTKQRGAPMEIRTPVLTLKGLRPGPLDDGGLAL